MPHLQWSNALDTGIDVIDEQHKRIIQYINELHDAQSTRDRNAVGLVVNDLVDYTISHFAFEESLMEQVDYPFLAPHKKVHELFIRKVDAFVRRFEAGEDVTADLINVLQRWLINHIKNEDGDYATYAQKKDARIENTHDGWLSRSLKRFFG
jgi:hemerythrin